MDPESGAGSGRNEEQSGSVAPSHDPLSKSQPGVDRIEGSND
jgi:hypothetical protein